LMFNFSVRSFDLDNKRTRKRIVLTINGESWLLSDKKANQLSLDLFHLVIARKYREQKNKED